MSRYPPLKLFASSANAQPDVEEEDEVEAASACPSTQDPFITPIVAANAKKRKQMSTESIIDEARTLSIYEAFHEEAAAEYQGRKKLKMPKISDTEEEDFLIQFFKGYSDARDAFDAAKKELDQRMHLLRLACELSDAARKMTEAKKSLEDAMKGNQQIRKLSFNKDEV
jgi:hypothetical protein